MKIFRAVGFTLIELVVVMGMAAILIAISLPGLLGVRARVDVRSNIYTVVSDIKAQQLKAMLGDTQNEGTGSEYGVHFETTSYTLFRGGTYNASDPDNIVVALSESLEFSNVSFPSSQIVFSKGSGEVIGFVSGQSSFTLTATSTQVALTADFNSVGVATSIE